MDYRTATRIEITFATRCTAAGFINILLLSSSILFIELNQYFDQTRLCPCFQHACSLVAPSDPTLRAQE